ncbi:Elongation factor P--(R)-beta-lysine ligase [Gammaproteobacteria bacterium]
MPRVVPNDEDWRPCASIEALRARALLYRRIRSFFEARGVLEVETPLASQAATLAPALDSLATRVTGPGSPAGRNLYLHTSPEFPMKRLLASGSGPIFQICKVFRDGERGSRHHPEFSLLEWYRPGFDQMRLMDEVTALLDAIGGPSRMVRRLSYAELFLETLGLDPHWDDPAVFCAEQFPVSQRLVLSDRTAWLDYLLTHHIEPRLRGQGVVMVYDYPANQAALARVRPGMPALASRFEVYLDGIELANGFHELNDAVEQRRRFADDATQRVALGKPLVPSDERFLRAIDAGLPDCAGVALGLDRWLMWQLGVEHIDQVLAFPLERA